jgi:hypothetical protein
LSLLLLSYSSAACCSPGFWNSCHFSSKYLSHSSIHPCGFIQITYLLSTYLPPYLPPSLPTYLPTYLPTRSCLPACLPASFLRFENFISFLILSSFSHPWGGFIHSRHLLNIRGPHPSSEIPIRGSYPGSHPPSEIPIRGSYPGFHPSSEIPSTIRDPNPRFLSRIPSIIRDPIRGSYPRSHPPSEIPSEVLIFLRLHQRLHPQVFYQGFIHLRSHPLSPSSNVPKVSSRYEIPSKILLQRFSHSLGLIQCLLPQGSLSHS